MRGVVTDSHYEQRDRQGRLMAMIARSYDQTQHRPFRGLGVNERTAVVVTPDGTATVHATSTSSNRAAFIYETTAAPQVLQNGQPPDLP